MEEIWRPVVDYEGRYEVSNLGRVKSLNWHRLGEERLMSPSINGRGYRTVVLTKNGTGGTKSVHRIVAKAFISNPNNLPCVNHKNENKLDNFVYVNEDGSVDLVKSNLEWCDFKYNINYSLNRKKTKE